MFIHKTYNFQVSDAKDPRHGFVAQHSQVLQQQIASDAFVWSNSVVE